MSVAVSAASRCLSGMVSMGPYGCHHMRVGRHVTDPPHVMACHGTGTHRRTVIGELCTAQQHVVTAGWLSSACVSEQRLSRLTHSSTRMRWPSTMRVPGPAGCLMLCAGCRNGCAAVYAGTCSLSPYRTAHTQQSCEGTLPAVYATSGPLSTPLTWYRAGAKACPAAWGNGFQ